MAIAKHRWYRILLDIVGLWSRSAMEVVALVTSCYISSGLDGVFMILGSSIGGIM